MELEQFENCCCFCDFSGTFWVTSVNRPKKALKVIRSFSKFACHHYIAKWGYPQNLKEIEEVKDFEGTFSMERAICISLNKYLGHPIALHFYWNPMAKLNSFLSFPWIWASAPLAPAPSLAIFIASLFLIFLSSSMYSPELRRLLLGVGCYHIRVMTWSKIYNCRNFLYIWANLDFFFQT